ncbi:MAG TPA: metalloregulator ArsR/SmtB family transcription factor [Candidatus Binataceae bacterium]|nr:metalloregulator ArsR/SmtB family transcription factor [Candidatus Binataceae bacterium]
MRDSASKALKPDCFRALADPTRRAVFNLLARGERSVSDLAQRFTISQPALSQHLAVLRAARLVRERKAGRFRYYRANPAGLKPVIDWIAQYEGFWRQKTLGRVLEGLV